MRLKCVWLKGLSVDSQYILAYMQEAPTFHIWHPIGEWCHKFLEPEFSLHVSPRWVGHPLLWVNTASHSPFFCTGLSSWWYLFIAMNAWREGEKYFFVRLKVTILLLIVFCKSDLTYFSCCFIHYPYFFNAKVYLISSRQVNLCGTE